MRICTKCNSLLPFDKFRESERGLHGRRSVCLECEKEYRRIAAVKKKPLPMYKTHKLCNSCNLCLSVTSFREIRERCKNNLYHQCLSCEKIREKIRRDSNKEYSSNYRKVHNEKAKATSREYYYSNKEKVLDYSKGRHKKQAKFEIYSGKLPPDDRPTNVNGDLYVVCKQCRELFPATVGQVHNRLNAVSGSSRGESNFYCSQECKDKCDVYRVKYTRKSERGHSQTARACQQGVRVALMQNQCDTVGYNYCESCGDIIDVNLHHISSIAENGIKAHEPANMIMMCHRCHTKTHKECV